MDIAQQENLKLSEALLLCQRELAQVREQQEPLEERCSRFKRERNESSELSDQLAQALAAHLSSTFWVEQATPRISLGRFLLSRWPRLMALLGRGTAADVLLEQARIREIEASELFDGAWYLKMNPDVAQAGVNPATHYLRAGAQEGRNPGPTFDTNAYVAACPALAESGLNPLLHHLRSRKA